MYELWDEDSRNLLGAYATEVEALAAVVEAIEDYGRESVEVLTLMLGYDGTRGQAGIVARGRELADRALEMVGSRSAQS